MVRFFPYTIRKPKAIEYLQRPTLQAICLSAEYFRAAFVDYTCGDAEPGHPCRSHEPAIIQRFAVCVAESFNIYPAGPAPMIKLRSRCKYCFFKDMFTKTYTSTLDSESILLGILGIFAMNI